MTINEYIEKYGTGLASAMLKMAAHSARPEARAAIWEVADALQEALEKSQITWENPDGPTAAKNHPG